MSFDSRLVQFIAVLCISWIILPAASAHEVHGIATVQARTPQEIVSAILSANTSGKTTVIHVAPGDYQFVERFDSADGPSFLPPITGTVLLIGKKRDTTRFIHDFRSGPTARFINVRENGILQVSGISLMGGFIDCFSVCSQTLGGGAALNAGGLLWFEDSVLSGNRAGTANKTFGGAILSTGGHLHVGNTTVSGNVSTRIGGGIAVLGGTATLLRSIVSGNSVVEGNAPNGAQRYGAGVYIEDAEVAIDHSTVSANATGSATGSDYAGNLDKGLGIFNESGTVSITNSAVVENTTQHVGAGGGIYNGGTMFVADSTVAGNAAGTFGGGIANFGKLTLQSVTVAVNQVYGAWRPISGQGGLPYPPGCDPFGQPGPPDLSGCISGGGGIWTDPAATTTVLSTAVALNTLNPAPGGSFGPDCAGVMISNRYNAIGVATDCQLRRPGSSSPAVSDQLGVDAHLGDLTDDGEPGNANVPILTGSPLIDAGGKVVFACGVRDQLGERRTDGDHDGRVECDVGAVEFPRNQNHPKH